MPLTERIRKQGETLFRFRSFIPLLLLPVMLLAFPEGNRIELYTPTPWHVEQPFGKLFDLNDSVEAIHQQTLEMIRDDPTFCPREQWASRLADKINNATR